jgi:hypothetical protein
MARPLSPPADFATSISSLHRAKSRRSTIPARPAGYSQPASSTPSHALRVRLRGLAPPARLDSPEVPHACWHVGLSYDSASKPENLGLCCQALSTSVGSGRPARPQRDRPQAPFSGVVPLLIVVNPSLSWTERMAILTSLRAAASGSAKRRSAVSFMRQSIRGRC